ncbi:MAG: ERF family protein [Lachnospiraceae bacterium]
MENPKIYESISAVMSEIGSIKKEKKSKQGYTYRGIDDVMNALHPLMADHGIFIVPEVLESSREDRTSSGGSKLVFSVCRIKYTFYASDGSSVPAVVMGEAMDSGDKSMSKAMATGLKYACFQVFCIPTDDIVDSDADAVTEKEIEALRLLLNEEMIDEAELLKAYNLKSLSDITDVKIKNLYQHFNKAKERCAIKSQGEVNGGGK